MKIYNVHGFYEEDDCCEADGNYVTLLDTLIKSEFDLNLQEYPIFDELFREHLNQKIIDHYRYYQIGFETGERFKYELNRKMNEIMPYFNQRYLSQLIEINPLLSFSRNTVSDKIEEIDSVVDVTENLSKNEINNKDETTSLVSDTIVDGSKTSNEVVDVTNDNAVETIDDVLESINEKDVGSDTPTSALLGGDIENEVYATRANIGDTTRNNDATRNSTETLAENKTGLKTDVTAETSNNVQDLDNNVAVVNDETQLNTKNNTQNMDKNVNTIITEDGFEIPLSKLLKDYRSTFINVDMEVITALRKMFMLIY